jgi:hypothetical protein
MFGKSNDPLQEALSQRSTGSLYRIAKSHSNFFQQTKFDYEYLGLSFSQRMMSFSVCVIVALILFFTALYRLMFIAINPTGFVVPYVLSNTIFFIMFGFISGFKTYFSRLFSKEKRGFTSAFIAVTLITIYSAFVMKKSIYIFAFGIIQLFTFATFLITFLPGGVDALLSLWKLAFKG